MLAELDQVKKQYKDFTLDCSMKIQLPDLSEPTEQEKVQPLKCFWDLYDQIPEKYGFLKKTEKICQKMTEER